MTRGGVRRILHTLMIYLIRSLLLLILLLAALLVYSNFYSIPQPLLQLGLAAASRGPVAFEADGARLHGVAQIEMHNLKIYVKHRLGKPLLEAGAVTLDFTPRGWLAGVPSINAIQVHDGIIHLRPCELTLKSKRPAETNFEFKYPHLVNVTLNNCRVYDLCVDRMSGVLVLDGNTANLSSIKGVLSGGAVSGTVSGEISSDFKQQKIDFDLVSNLNPRALFSIFAACKGDFLLKLLGRFEFPGPPPRLQWKISLNLGAHPQQYVSGEFRMRDVLYRGVYFARADGRFSVENSADDLTARLDRLFVVNSNGFANVSFVAKPRTRRLEYVADSSLAIRDIFRMIGLMTNFFAKKIVINGPVTVTSRGVFDFSPSHTNTNLRATFKGDEARVFGFLCDSGACDVVMRGRYVAVTNIVGNIYGGFVSGHVEVPKMPNGVRYTGIPIRLFFKIHGVNFDSIVKRARYELDPEHYYQGIMSGSIRADFETGKDAVKTLNGQGSIHIDKGRVFMLPVFGGLSSFMVKVIPGLGFILSQNDAIFDFHIKNGRVITDKLKVEGDVLSLKGKGAYMIGEELDFYVQVKLLKGKTFGGKLFQALTSPISKLFEFKVHGPISAPEWYPVNFSFDIFRKTKREMRY